MGIRDFFQRSKSKLGPGNAMDLKDFNSSIQQATKSIHGFVAQLDKSAKLLCDSIKCSEEATEVTKQLGKQYLQAGDSAEEMTDEVKKLNDKVRQNARESSEAGEKNEKLSAAWEKAKDILRGFGVELGKAALAWRAYSEHLQAAKRVHDNVSKGGGNLLGAPTTRMSAFNEARKMKEILNDAADSAVELGYDIEEGLNASAEVMRRMGSGVAKTRQEYRQITKDVLTTAFATGQEYSEVITQVDKGVARFRKSAKDMTRELTIVRSQIDTLRQANDGFYMATDDYVKLITEASMQTKHYANDQLLLGHVMSTIIDKTYKQTKNQEYAIETAKEAAKIFEEPPPWMDVSITSKWLNQALNDMDSFLETLKDEAPGVRDEVTAILNELKSGALDREGARYAISEALKGTRTFNKAMIEEGKRLLSQGGNVRTLMATFGLDVKGARALFKMIQSGDLEHLDSLEQTNKKADELAQTYEQVSAATKNAADESQGLGKQLNNLFRSDGMKLVTILGLGAVGGGALRGLGGGITRMLGGGASGGVSGIVKRLLGGENGSAGGAAGGVAQTVLGGTGAGCVQMCDGGLGSSMKGLENELEAGRKEASSLAPSAGAGAAGILKKMVRYGGIFATGINAIGSIRDVYEALSSDASSDEKVGKISGAIGDTALDVSLGYLTGGIFPLVRSMFKEQYNAAKNAAVDWTSGLFDDLLSSADDKKKRSQGMTSREAVQWRAESGEVKYGGPSSSVKTLMDQIYSGDKVRPEYMWLVNQGLLSGTITDEKAAEIRAAIASRKNGPQIVKMPTGGATTQRGANTAYEAFLAQSSALTSKSTLERKLGDGSKLKLEDARLNSQGKMVATAKFEMSEFGSIFAEALYQLNRKS